MRSRSILSRSPRALKTFTWLVGDANICKLLLIGASLWFVFALVLAYRRRFTVTMSKTTFITQTEEASTGVVGGGRKRAVRSPHGVLVVERSATLLGVEYAVRDTFVIGKKDADITLTDSLVSRRHARLLVQNSQVSIEDLGSTNGTFIRRSGGLVIEVNGSPEVLEDGDEVLLGPPDEPSAVVLRYKRGTN
ncbi:MAG: hypothetical protein KatS3mg055_3034 [Chloroflexus sp.]|nr:MAG: hypothetical protein KatS3mg055_3034 [Chloroflexus sp.]